MLRTRLAPLLLLIAAAASFAAVFAVHRIEAGGGPLNEPWASRYISPGVTEATIRFTTRRAERITIQIHDAAGTPVRQLLDDEVVDGPLILTWDGRDDAGDALPDGPYDVTIQRAGDARTYAPTRPITVDTVPPRAQLLRAVIVDGKLNARVLVEPGTRVQVRDADDEPLPGLRAWRRDGDEQPADAPADSFVLRMSVTIPQRARPIDSLRVVARDRAGNELDLLTEPGAPRIEERS